jgi:hypothetical protein
MPKDKATLSYLEKTKQEWFKHVFKSLLYTDEFPHEPVA